jgi:hypothetical protein
MEQLLTRPIEFINVTLLLAILLQSWTCKEIFGLSCKANRLLLQALLILIQFSLPQLNITSVIWLDRIITGLFAAFLINKVKIQMAHLKSQTQLAIMAQMIYLRILLIL